MQCNLLYVIDLNSYFPKEMHLIILCIVFTQRGILLTKNLNLGLRRREHPLISLNKKVSDADIMFTSLKGTMALDKKKCGFGKELAAPNLFKNKNT